MDIDSRDWKILYLLDIDAKQSATKIAKRVRLSKEAVNYRINKLIDQGIIKRRYAILNTPALGYLHYKFLFKLQNVDQKKEEEIITFFANHPNVIWCVKAYGSWDLSVSYLVKNIKTLDHFVGEIVSKFGHFIKEKAVSQIIDAPTFHRAYLLKSVKGKQFHYRETPGKIALGRLDHNILVELAQDASQTYINLAKKLGTTRDIVNYAIKQLTKKNIIQGFRIAIDHAKLGILYYKIMFSLVNLTDAEERRFLYWCEINPNILQFIKYVGPWEIEIELEVFSEKELYEILFALRKEFSSIIKSYEILKLEERKINYFPFEKI